MADSAFWRDLASQFQALHDFHGTLRFDWHYQIGSGAVGRWEPAGSASGSIRSQFESLARRAAVEIPNKETSDLLIAWLEALRQDRSNFSLGPYFIEKNEDGSEGAHHLTGSIYDVCEASANFCRALEGRALQAEFEETQRKADIEAAQPITNARLDPKALCDSYFANFPDEKIKIRDLCWATGQHYREWKRWLAGELKDGSTPDLAFHRILSSGKRPLEFNKRPLPKGWE